MTMIPPPSPEGPSPPPGLQAPPPAPAQVGLGPDAEVRSSVVGRLIETVRGFAEEAVEEKVCALRQRAEARVSQFEEKEAKATGKLEEEVRSLRMKNEALEEALLERERSVAALQERLQLAEAMLGLTPSSSAMAPPLARTPAPMSYTTPEMAAAAQASEAKYPPMPPCPPFPVARAEGGGEGAGLSRQPVTTPVAAAAAAAAAFGTGLASASDQASSDGSQSSGTTIKISDLLSSPPRQQAEEACGVAKPAKEEPPAPPPGLEDEDIRGLPSGLQSPQPTRSQPAISPQAPLMMSPQPRLTVTPQRARDTTPQPPRTPTLTPQRPLPRSSPRTPLHAKSPAVPPSPFVICEGGGCVFGFTLRRAEGVEVGLKVNDEENSLVISSILPGGAIEAWNRQCVGGPAAGKALTPGDRIVCVNSASDSKSMLEECRAKQMLRFTVTRGNPDDIKCDVEGLWSGTDRRNGRPRAPPSCRVEAVVSDAFAGATMTTMGSPRTTSPAVAGLAAEGRPPARSPVLRASAEEFVPAGQCS